MNSILTLLSVCFATFAVSAQIPNGNFEQLHPDSSIKNWEISSTISIGLNDSILSDGKAAQYSTISNSGLYAMELRNGGYNFTQNMPLQKYKVGCQADTVISFNPNFPISQKVQSLNLYYRFLSNPLIDTVRCTVQIMNVDGLQIGEGIKDFWDVKESYQLANIPIQYDFNGGLDSIPANAMINFGEQINASVPHIGMRFLVDDLSFTVASPLAIDNMDANIKIENPFYNTIRIHNLPNNTNCRLLNTFGQLVYEGQDISKQDFSGLSQGIYFLKLEKGITKLWKK
jgi:hypothetical protein